MSILSAIKQQNSSIDDLAALPQAMIMQMAQKKQISEDMLAPILSRKAELAEAFARQKALEGANQPQPTVMEQLMARNAMAENPPVEQPMAQQMPQSIEEVGIAQNPVPPMQLAGGGIIAFGNGGDVDDSEDFAYDMAREEADMNMGSSIADIYKMARRGAGKLMDMIPESYEAIKKKVATFEMPKAKGGHPLESKAVAVANKVGLDPQIMLYALNKETGGLKDPATAKSKAGAYGPMQLMAGTAKDLGVDRTDVDQNLYGGAVYLKQMLDKYKDPQLALAAYNAGPGRVDKALRSSVGISALPRETQNYMRYAQGGEIHHFYEGDYVDPMMGTPIVTDPEMGSMRGAILGTPENLLENKKITQKEYADIKKRQDEAKAAAKPKEPSKEEPKPDLQTIFADLTRKQRDNPEKDVFAEMIARNEANREDIKKSAAEDRNLALLASGLGMLGGTSPYAFANIGQGGMKGLEYLGASKTRRSSELNALSNAELKALYYGQENKRKQQALAEGMRDKELDNLATYDAKLRKQFFMEGVTPTAKQLEAYEMAKRNDPLYQVLTKNAGVYSAPSAQKRTIDFSTIR